MFDSEETVNSNYPTETDTEFTPDEQEAIKEYKTNLKRKIDKNRSVLKGFEAAFWGVTSFSLARYLVLTAGTAGLVPAIASAFLINNIVNRDCLDKFRLDRTDGEFQVEGMGKLLRFALTTIGTAVVLWGSVGDFYHIYSNSQTTYDNLNKTVEEFQRLPQDDKTNWLILAVAGGAGFGFLVNEKMKG